MNRKEKATEVQALAEGFKGLTNAVLVGFSGLSVAEVDILRGKIRESSAGYRVVKNRLAVRAIPGTPLQTLESSFEGPTAVAYNSSDPVSLAKVLSDFSHDHPALIMKVGVIDGKQVVSEEELKGLAKLPGLPELRAQLLNLIQTPATRTARLLQTPGTQLAQVIQARCEKMMEATAPQS